MKVATRTNFTHSIRSLILLWLLLSLLAACGDNNSTAIPAPGLDSNGSTAAPVATATVTSVPTKIAVTTPTTATQATKPVSTATLEKKIVPTTTAANTPVVNNQPNPIINITAQPGQHTEFKLKIGQTALVQPDNIQIKFSRVVNDERCANCYVSGPIVLETVVSQNGQTLGTFTLSDRRNDKYKTAETFKGYTLSVLIVAPNRCGGCDEIKPDEYEASFQLG